MHRKGLGEALMTSTGSLNNKLVENNESDSDSSDDDLVPNIKFYSVNEAIEAAGGFGKFQWIYVPLVGLSFIPSGFFIYNLNYLTLMPRLI